MHASFFSFLHLFSSRAFKIIETTTGGKQKQSENDEIFNGMEDALVGWMVGFVDLQGFLMVVLLLVTAAWANDFVWLHRRLWHFSSFSTGCLKLPHMAHTTLIDSLKLTKRMWWAGVVIFSVRLGNSFCGDVDKHATCHGFKSPCFRSKNHYEIDVILA